jgi:hypothetical protein
LDDSKRLRVSSAVSFNNVSLPELAATERGKAEEVDLSVQIFKATAEWGARDCQAMRRRYHGQVLQDVLILILFVMSFVYDHAMPMHACQEGEHGSFPPALYALIDDFCRCYDNIKFSQFLKCGLAVNMNGLD